MNNNGVALVKGSRTKEPPRRTPRAPSLRWMIVLLCFPLAVTVGSVLIPWLLATSEEPGAREAPALPEQRAANAAPQELLKLPAPEPAAKQPDAPKPEGTKEKPEQLPLPQAEEKPLPRPPAPEGFRDFQLGMMRREVWKTLEQLKAKPQTDRTVYVPGYNRIQGVRFWFTDGLDHAMEAYGRFDEELHQKAELHRVDAVYQPIQRPARPFATEFVKIYGPPVSIRDPHRNRLEGTLDDQIVADRQRFLDSTLAWRITDLYRWEWAEDDRVVFLELQVEPNRERGVGYQLFFTATFSVEKDLLELEKEIKSERNRLARIRAEDLQNLATQTTDRTETPEKQRAESPPLRCGSFFGQPVLGRRLLPLTGASVWAEPLRQDQPLDKQLSTVVWQEFRDFVDRLPRAARIPVSNWQLGNWRGVDVLFLPPLPKMRADLLGRLYRQGAHIETRPGSVLPMEYAPKAVLERAIDVDPDVVLLVASRKDIPLASDALEELVRNRLKLPRFDIVEIPPGIQEGSDTAPIFKTLAVRTKGSYRILGADRKTLRTIVPPPDE